MINTLIIRYSQTVGCTGHAFRITSNNFCLRPASGCWKGIHGGRLHRKNRKHAIPLYDSIRRGKSRVNENRFNVHGARARDVDNAPLRNTRWWMRLYPTARRESWLAPEDPAILVILLKCARGGVVRWLRVHVQSTAAGNSIFNRVLYGVSYVMKNADWI